jgi:DNA-binding NtrC family response regulator
MDKPLRALIIEDSEDDTLLLVRELKRSDFDVTYQRVETAKGMKTALTESWDIVFSDHKMPHFNSFEALKILKENGTDTPFIIISGVIGEEVAVAAMKAGAHDYVMKGHLNRLGPVIERAQQEMKLRKENRIVQQSLQESEKKYRGLQPGHIC